MSFRFVLLFTLIAVFSETLCFQAAAQSEPPIYKGLRISLFHFSIKKQKPESVSLQLDVVNTGRLPVSFGRKDERAPEQLVVELDTVNLPLVLHGRESLIAQAVLNEKISLSPGETLRGLSLEITMKASEHAPLLAANGDSLREICSDLVFDTAYIAQYTEETMLLQFLIRNAGEAPARLLGKSNDTEDNLAVNVYFVGGTKLTRGAILAEGTFIQEGRETLDGVLLPGQALLGEIEIRLDKRTRFSPNLLFELDPFQTVGDCDRTNNTRAVEVEF